jgi:hypothetical protein
MQAKCAPSLDDKGRPARRFDAAKVKADQVAAAAGTATD